jgi:glycine/D-amino acid oxidase-like deaminating enzyme
MGQSRLAACQRCRLLAAIESDRIHDVSYPVMYPSPTSPLDHLADKEFDVVVVGAGITGACIALDAATRGLRTALIDRADYGSGATANCLRIVHGGLRYLQHLDVRRSRESIVERSMWLRSAPHLVEPLPIVVPTKRGQFPGRWTLGAGLAVNELLSADRNAEIEADRQIPRSRVLSRQECLRLAPDAGHPDISGGILFHDAIMYSPERLTLEVVAAAAIAGATTANYVAFESPRVHDGKVSGCLLRDVLTNDVCEVRTHWIVNSSDLGVRVLKGDAEQTVIGYSTKSRTVFVDRTKSGNVSFHPAFAGRHAGPLEPNAQGNIRLQIFVDACSVEVFGNSGETVITDLVFPDSNSNGVELFAAGGTCRVVSCQIHAMKSVWPLVQMPKP